MKIMVHRIILSFLFTAGCCLVPSFVYAEGDAALVTVKEVVAADM